MIILIIVFAIVLLFIWVVTTVSSLRWLLLPILFVFSSSVSIHSKIMRIYNDDWLLLLLFCNYHIMITIIYCYHWCYYLGDDYSCCGDFQAVRFQFAFCNDVLSLLKSAEFTELQKYEAFLVFLCFLVIDWLLEIHLPFQQLRSLASNTLWDYNVRISKTCQIYQ